MRDRCRFALTLFALTSAGMGDVRGALPDAADDLCTWWTRADLDEGGDCVSECYSHAVCSHPREYVCSARQVGADTDEVKHDETSSKK